MRTHRLLAEGYGIDDIRAGAARILAEAPRGLRVRMELGSAACRIEPLTLFGGGLATFLAIGGVAIVDPEPGSGSRRSWVWPRRPPSRSGVLSFGQKLRRKARTEPRKPATQVLQRQMGRAIREARRNRNRQARARRSRCRSSPKSRSAAQPTRCTMRCQRISRKQLKQLP